MKSIVAKIKYELPNLIVYLAVPAIIAVVVFKANPKILLLVPAAAIFLHIARRYDLRPKPSVD